MNRVRIQSYVRIGAEFQPIQDIKRYDGDSMYVPGAVSLVVDEVELMGIELWDDINWLWPFIVQAVDDYRKTGTGKRGFPDQPISFKVEAAWPGHALVSVVSDSFEHKAVVPEDELYSAVAHAGLTFFTELQRICSEYEGDDAEIGVLRSWLDDT